MRAQLGFKYFDGRLVNNVPAFTHLEHALPADRLLAEERIVEHMGYINGELKLKTMISRGLWVGSQEAFAKALARYRAAYPLNAI